MILHMEDWANYPGAIIDTQTSNESFLRLAAIYKKMGVRNHAFLLSLLQPELQGVDPFDENLDLITKQRIATECRWNPWYCLREIIRLPPQGGPDPIRFKAHRGNIALAWAFFNHIDFALIQPRQTGKSVGADAVATIVEFLMGTNAKMQLVTKDAALRRANISRIKSIRDLLPDYLNPTTADDADNTEMLTCKARENEYKTAVGRSAREAADNLGRGLTSEILQCDEVPYIPNIHISLPVGPLCRYCGP